MPRKSKLSAAEIEAAEIAEVDRKEARGHGFDMMKIRDSGHGFLHDRAGSRRVAALWHVEPDKRTEGVLYRNIPAQSIGLEFQGKDGKTDFILLSTDDLQRFLRWT